MTSRDDKGESMTMEAILAHAMDESLEPRNRLQGVVSRLRLLIDQSDATCAELLAEARAETSAVSHALPNGVPAFDPVAFYRAFPAGGNNERGDWLSRCLANMLDAYEAAKLAGCAPSTTPRSATDPDEAYDGWAEPERMDELLREIIQMTDSAGIKRKAEEVREALKAPRSATACSEVAGKCADIVEAEALNVPLKKGLREELKRRATLIRRAFGVLHATDGGKQT